MQLRSTRRSPGPKANRERRSRRVRWGGRTASWQPLDATRHSGGVHVGDAVTGRFGAVLHTDSDLEPTDLLAVPVEIHDDIAIQTVALETLPAGWRTFPAPPALALVGDSGSAHPEQQFSQYLPSWFPHERNFVLNPTHREFARIVLGRSEPFSFDPSMWKT